MYIMHVLSPHNSPGYILYAQTSVPYKPRFLTFAHHLLVEGIGIKPRIRIWFFEHISCSPSLTPKFDSKVKCWTLFDDDL